MVDGLWGDFVEKADLGRGALSLHTVGPGGFGCPHGRQVLVSGPGWPSQGELEGAGGEGQWQGEKAREQERTVRPLVPHSFLFLISGSSYMCDKHRGRPHASARLWFCSRWLMTHRPVSVSTAGSGLPVCRQPALQWGFFMAVCVQEAVERQPPVLPGGRWRSVKPHAGPLHTEGCCPSVLLPAT